MAQLANRTAMLLAAALLLAAGPAAASYTIDLIWATTGTSHLDYSSFSSLGVADSGTPCHTGARSQGGLGSCLLIRLTAAASFSSAVVTLGWNLASGGPPILFAPVRSFGQFGNSPLVGFGATSPKVAATNDCALACDTAFGSFGGAGGAPAVAGTYVIGSILFSPPQGPFPAPILPFLRTQVDGVTDKQFVSAPVQLNGATIFVAPEPGTAALFGLGILALACCARSRES